MNDKQEHLDNIVDIVVDCCATTIYGKVSLTKEELIGKCRKGNVVMSRSILATLIYTEGYTVETIGLLLGCSEHAVRNMLKKWHDFYDTSRAFRVASSQATLRVKSLGDKFIN